MKRVNFFIGDAATALLSPDAAPTPGERAAQRTRRRRVAALRGSNVRITTDSAGQSREGCEALLREIGDESGLAEYLIVHAAPPVPHGWRFLKFRRCSVEADEFHLCVVRPNFAGRGMCKGGRCINVMLASSGTSISAATRGASG